MTPEEYEKLEGLIVKATQSGKKETSGLVADLKSEFLSTVRNEIKVTVNGKIDNIKTHLTEQDAKLSDIHTEQSRVALELAEFKKRVEPLIESRMTVLNVGRFVIWMGALAGASAGIIWLVDKIRMTK